MPYTFDVSVVMPFGDDEDVIGAAVRRLSAHLREYGATFEIIAVDEASGDNSHAVLALLRPNIPELRIASAVGRGRAYYAGAQRARGHVLWLIDPDAAMTPLAPFGRAYRRVSRGELDLVAVDHRFALCHRTNALPVIEGLRGSGHGYRRRLAKRAEARGLATETLVIGGASRSNRGIGHAAVSWLFETIGPARLGRNILAERQRW
jgi:glycosyltransferase involved in cell wall biosynthesis